jgi:hypothetical protein
MDPTPRLLNCYLGALLIRRRLGGRVRSMKVKGWWRPRHYFCQTPDGQLWHFKRLRHILPWPLGYLLFWGRFENMTDRKGAGR